MEKENVSGFPEEGLFECPCGIRLFKWLSPIKCP
ncbi:hypothetical protein OROGR_024679 [Orobanche gracilis]